MYIILKGIIAAHGLWAFFLVLALSATFYGFYLDEGYFNFDWMDKTTNWITFSIYVTTMFIGQLVVRLFLDRVFVQLH